MWAHIARGPVVAGVGVGSFAWSPAGSVWRRSGREWQSGRSTAPPRAAKPKNSADWRARWASRPGHSPAHWAPNLFSFRDARESGAEEIALNLGAPPALLRPSSGAPLPHRQPSGRA